MSALCDGCGLVGRHAAGCPLGAAARRKTSPSASELPRLTLEQVDLLLVLNERNPAEGVIECPDCGELSSESVPSFESLEEAFFNTLYHNRKNGHDVRLVIYIDPRMAQEAPEDVL